MAITLDTFKAQVDNLLSADNNELAVLARYRNIKAALERYSRDMPDDYVEDEVGDGGKYYKLTGTSAVLANWIEGFSRVMEIEYPAVTIASDGTPVYLQPEDFRDDYWQGGDRYLFLPNHSPAATETMRIRFGVPYDWTASAVSTAVTQTAHGFVVNDYVYLDGSTWYEATDPRVATHKVTVVATDTFTAVQLQADPPVQDFFAVCHLAAGLCCQAISARYSRTSDSTINADAVDHRTRGDMFASRAKEFIKMYERHIGLGAPGEDGKAVQAAGAFVDWDTEPGWPTGRQYIFHGKGMR